MGFKAQFSKFRHQQIIKHSGKRIGEIYSWQLSLTNTNWIGSTSVIASFYDYYGTVQPKSIAFVAKARQTYIFNEDTVGWTWAQGDMMILSDQHGNMLDRYIFYLHEYKQGECPECHGTRKCSACGGWGHTEGGYLGCDWIPCGKCLETGICQTCYVPHRYHNGAEVRIPVMPKRLRPMHIIERDLASVRNDIDKLSQKLQTLRMTSGGFSGAFTAASEKMRILEEKRNKLEGERQWTLKLGSG